MSATAYKANGYARVYFRHDHDGVNLPDCCTFEISHCGALVLYGESGGKLLRAYAPGQWIFVTMVYPDDQGNK